MPRERLDEHMKIIREDTGLSMIEIRELALVEYIATYDFKKARTQKRKKRRDLIRYAVKKHGEEARGVLSEMRVPITPHEWEFYEKCLSDRWKNK